MRHQPLISLNFWFDHSIPWIVLAILLIYTYALFVRIPYSGFGIDTADGTVEYVFVHAKAGADLQEGDRLIEVGSVQVEDYLSLVTQPLVGKVATGQVLPILLQRGVERRVVPWVMPGPNPQEIRFRLVNVYLLAYVFWICGLAVKQNVRPKDNQWRLLILLFFLTAIWLMSGFVSSFKIWMSPVVFRSAIWLSVPVCLHLHWIMPRPLAKAPVVLLWLGYAVFVALGAAEWFLVLPKNTYLLGAALLCVGTLILLGLHYFFQPAQRWELRILGLGLMVAVIPTLVVNLIGIFLPYPPTGEFSLLTIPALPTAYFYVISRKKLGNLELRTNRAITGYIFLILLGMVVFSLLPLLEKLFQANAFPLVFSMIFVLFCGLFIFAAFQRFECWMDRRIFGIKLLPDRLLQEYSTRISTSLDLNSITHQLKDEFLPSLLIRQSVLLRLKGNAQVSLVYAAGTEFAEMPGGAEIDALWTEAGRFIPPPEDQGWPGPYSWVRLVLGMQVGGERVGLWLLGRRDPDDFYAQAEISMLQAIANQTASALVNTEQAAQLHALYQANIERHEEERIRLASDLHDEVLNQLAVLSMNIGNNHSPAIEEQLQEINDRLRQVITGLRPAMLNYGLRAGLEELVDEISERTRDGVVVRLEIPATQVRYEPRVEGHLYRIVQQATENAVRHSGGLLIRIYGDLKPDSASLVVEDDGAGFPDVDHLDFEHFLSHRHFGLARMFERAAIIRAELRIHSLPGQGSIVSVDWPSDQTSSPTRV